VAPTESECVTNVKTDMSKQYNKAEKKKRRLSYLKRKKAGAKAKATTKVKAAAKA
jgi:hypothetical protein